MEVVVPPPPPPPPLPLLSTVLTMAHSEPYGCVASINQTSLQPTDPAKIVRDLLDHDIKLIPPDVVAKELEFEFDGDDDDDDAVESLLW